MRGPQSEERSKTPSDILGAVPHSRRLQAAGCRMQARRSSGGGHRLLNNSATVPSAECRVASLSLATAA